MIRVFSKFLVVLAVGLSTAALGQAPGQRTLPAKGKVGVLGEAAPLPIVQVNGETLRLAPGGVIYDESNRTILHGALPPSAKVFYTTNPNGDVLRMYILTPAEQTALERAGK